MKKLIVYILFVTMLPLGACKKDFLNISPVDQFSDATVWNDAALIQTFINNIYSGIPHGFSNIMMGAAVDDAMYNADFGMSNITKSLVTPGDLSIFDADYWCGNRLRLMNWTNVYKFVRATNIFFEKIDAAPIDDATKKKYIGEVHFLRAYLYHNLVSMYGGVPIITKAYSLTDDFAVERNTFDDCVKFIVDDCDQAAANLPLVQTGNDKGRATKGAALALKARVLLHAASDFYNSGGAWAGGYSNKALIGYVGGDRTARWQAAKNAAKAVMDLGLYSLYKPTPASQTEAQKNYGEIFLSMETSEDIFVKYFTGKINEDWDGYNPGLYYNPNGYHGWGSGTPCGQLVDAYEMSDGSKFDWNNAAHKAAPYNNREPRFYSSILYDGAKWRQRPSDVIPNDPVGIIQTGFYEQAGGTLKPGLDTRKSPFEDWNGTYTGYFLKKFIDPTIDAQFNKQVQPWRYIRYTEIVLNYAEACLGLGQEAEAKTYINMIRRRAGMPDVTESGQALIDRYRHERQIELAFEDHRYFDVRRWMIADQAYKDCMGVSILYKQAAPTVPEYSVIVAQQRAWLPRFYLLPIKSDEMNRNNKLVQNPLY
jgi:hypothetical protein